MKQNKKRRACSCIDSKSSDNTYSNILDLRKQDFLSAEKISDRSRFVKKRVDSLKFIQLHRIRKVCKHAQTSPSQRFGKSEYFSVKQRELEQGACHIWLVIWAVGASSYTLQPAIWWHICPLVSRIFEIPIRTIQIRLFFEKRIFIF